MAGQYIRYPSAASGGGGGGLSSISFSVGTLNGQTASPNGASVSSNSIFLQTATATNPGLVSSGNQTFAGTKTFNASPIVSPLNAASPLFTNSSGQLVSGSVSLVNQVSGSLSVNQGGSQWISSGSDIYYNAGGTWVGFPGPTTTGAPLEVKTTGRNTYSAFIGATTNSDGALGIVTLNNSFNFAISLEGLNSNNTLVVPMYLQRQGGDLFLCFAGGITTTFGVHQFATTASGPFLVSSTSQTQQSIVTQKASIGSGFSNAMLTISSNSSYASPPANTNIHVIGANDRQNRLTMDAVGSGTSGAAGLFLRRGRGTGATPTQSLTDDTLGFIGAVGYGATAFGAVTSGTLSFKAAQNWTDTNQGTYFHVSLNANSTTTAIERFVISDAGVVRLSAYMASTGPIFSTGSGGTLVSGSVSLTNQVSGSLPFASVSGSVSLTAQVSGILPIANGGTNASVKATAYNNLTPITTSGDITVGSGSNNAIRLAGNTSNSTSFLMQIGSGSISQLPTWQPNSGPTIQTFTVGSGTYTVPSNVRWLRVRASGGGGGGGGGANFASNDGGAGATGTATFFGGVGSTSLIVAGGGLGSAATSTNGTNGGAGGTASITAPAVGVAITGNTGGSGGTTTTGVTESGGYGAPNPFFGGMPLEGRVGIGAGAAAVNSGAGGAGSGAAATQIAGGGGGSGAVVEAIIRSPVASYAYTVGSGGAIGAAGTAGGSGGGGASGIIWIEEHYI